MWSAIPASAWYTPSATEYREVRQVGEGTYGKVYEGRYRLNNKIVALKKVKLVGSSDRPSNAWRGLPQNCLREIRLLKTRCQHENVVKLLDVATSIMPGSEKHESDAPPWEETPAAAEGATATSGFLYLVFEYVEHDLGGVLTSKYKFPLEAIKSISQQIFQGLAYLHEQNICHRDIKCSNILIGRDHRVKLADFGLARELVSFGNSGSDSSAFCFTNNVITRWYRPPELLLGEKNYTLSVDVWSVGCIIWELFTNTPMFPGKDDVHQLKKIFEILGKPSLLDWPRIKELPNFNLFETSTAPPHSPHAAVIQHCEKHRIDPEAAQLLMRCLAMDPDRRCTSKQALESRFLSDAKPHHLLPLMETTSDKSLHDWETKQETRKLEAQLKLQKQQLAAAPGDNSSSNNNSAAALPPPPLAAPIPPPAPSAPEPPPRIGSRHRRSRSASRRDSPSSRSYANNRDHHHHHHHHSRDYRPSSRDRGGGYYEEDRGARRRRSASPPRTGAAYFGGGGAHHHHHRR